jgi:glycine/D-amino acid oxidase-like deaminating enzyme
MERQINRKAAKILNKQVAIVGAGITGLSTAAHLRELGVNDFILIDSASRDQATKSSPGIALKGFWDNYTRISHAHGPEFGAELWHTTHRGFDALRSYLGREKIAHDVGMRIRLIVAEDELVEAGKAIQQLNQAGFGAELIRCDSNMRKEYGLGERVLAIQNEGPNTGMTFDPNDLIGSLRDKIDDSSLLKTKATKIEASAKGVAIHTEMKTVHCDLVVLACHLNIRAFVPEIRSALVPVADQWSVMTGGGSFASLRMTEGSLRMTKATTPNVFSAFHSYEWGAITAPGRFIFGGGRFLRPLAGIEAEAPSVETKIENFLKGQLAKNFADIGTPSIESSTGGLECRPCDELPVIGPMFGEDRILLATGYMGNGFVLGFLAGRYLAQLIAIGKGTDIPNQLWPRRLRSLG